MSFSGKTALITGASSGLGKEFAQQLANQGANLVLVARRQQALEALAEQLKNTYSIHADVISMDLNAANAAQNLFTECQKHNFEVDILVNNAGFGTFGDFIQTPLETTENMLNLDMMVPTQLTHLFAKPMLDKGSGHILQIASIGAYQATPTYAAYSAAKSYVLLFGEAINYELKNQGIKVTTLSPGITATEFLQVSGQKATAYQRLFMMKPQQVVKTGLKALSKGKASVVPGFMNKLTIFFNRLSPRFMQRAIAHQLMKN